jgi:hypothetical protein
MKRKLLIVTALIWTGICSAGAQSTNVPDAAPIANPPAQTTPVKMPSQEQASEIMKAVNDALTKNGYPGYKITVVAASPSASAAGAGGAATGTVPAPNCTFVVQTPFGTLSLC